MGQTIINRWRAAALAGPALAFALAGCAEINSIHRRAALPEGASSGEVITVDAKQRHLLILPEKDTNRETRWRVCAEAAPDVFSAFATSAGLRGDKHGGEASIASAETAASIERTQTINMIRESFYRTCERYASGAIGRVQFVVQAARDHRSMVAILAIEQLTGALRPKSTVISGPLTAASTLSGADAADIVKDYNDRLKAAETKRDQAQAALTAAKADKGVCSAGDGANANACAVLETQLTAAKGDVEKAQTGLDNAVKLAKDLVSATAASAGGGTNLQSGGIAAAEIDEASLAAVAMTVKDIVALSFVDEPLMFCIGYLTDPDETLLGRHEDILTGCLAMLAERQSQDTQLRYAKLTLDPATIAIGFMDSWAYGKFRSLLARRVAAVPAAELAARLARFETALGSSLGIARYCPDTTACVAYVHSDNDPYKNESKDRARAAAALDVLTKP